MGFCRMGAASNSSTNSRLDLFGALNIKLSDTRPAKPNDFAIEQGAR